MISFGSIPLHSPSASEVAFAFSKINPAAFWEYQLRTALTKNLLAMPFFAYLQRPITLGSLLWPSGASRFSVYHGMVGTAQLEQIKALAFDEAGYQSLPLVIDDSNYSIETDLFMLPARAMAECGVATNEELWLITLVDERYFWWFKAENISIADETNWEVVYSTIGSALGVTITPDDIPSVYLSAPSQLSGQYEFLPILLDAVAASVGQRIVRQLDGTVQAQNAANAFLQGVENLDSDFPRKAGGSMDPETFAGTVPSTLTITFPYLDTTQGVWPATISLEGSTFDGSRVIHSTAVGDATAGTPDNEAELNLLANQIASDWQGFQKGYWDVAYLGPVPWVPEALTDMIEWHHSEGAIFTRAMRGPWDQWPDMLMHYSSVGASLVPVGGYFGATTTTTNGWIIKDGLVFKVGDDTASSTFNLTVRDSSDTPHFENTDTITTVNAKVESTTPGDVTITPRIRWYENGVIAEFKEPGLEVKYTGPGTVVLGDDTTAERAVLTVNFPTTNGSLIMEAISIDTTTIMNGVTTFTVTADPLPFSDLQLYETGGTTPNLSADLSLAGGPYIATALATDSLGNETTLSEPILDYDQMFTSPGGIASAHNWINFVFFFDDQTSASQRTRFYINGSTVADYTTALSSGVFMLEVWCQLSQSSSALVSVWSRLTGDATLPALQTASANVAAGDNTFTLTGQSGVGTTYSLINGFFDRRRSTQGF